MTSNSKNYRPELPGDRRPPFYGLAGRAAPFSQDCPRADFGQGRGPGRHRPGHGQETQIPRELEVLGEVVSKSLAQISAQVPGRVSKI